jgi:glutamyl-tRNA reductase
MDKKTAEVIDDLTRVLSKKLLTDATFAIRASAEAGDLEAAEALLKAITQGERLSCNGPGPKKRNRDG